MDAAQDAKEIPANYWENKNGIVTAVCAWMSNHYGIEAVNALGQQLTDAEFRRVQTRFDTGAESDLDIDGGHLRLSHSARTLGGMLVTTVVGNSLIDVCSNMHKSITERAPRSKQLVYARIVDVTSVALHNNQGRHSEHILVTFQFCRHPEPQSWMRNKDEDGNECTPYRMSITSKFCGWLPMEDIKVAPRTKLPVFLADGEPVAEDEDWSDVDEDEDLESEAAEIEEEARMRADREYQDEMRAEREKRMAAAAEKVNSGANNAMGLVQVAQELDQENDQKMVEVMEAFMLEEDAKAFGYELPDPVKAILAAHRIPDVKPYGEMSMKSGSDFTISIGHRLLDSMGPEMLAKLDLDQEVRDKLNRKPLPLPDCAVIQPAYDEDGYDADPVKAAFAPENAIVIPTAVAYEPRIEVETDGEDKDGRKGV